MVHDKDFEKSDTGKDAHESKEELKYTQDCDIEGIIILNNLNEKEMNDPRVQAIFKHSRHNNSYIFLISLDYHELLKRKNRTKGNIYHIFKPNNFRVVQNLYQDKASVDMTFNELKYLISTCWDKTHQPLNIDMTKVKYTGRY